MKEIIVDLFAGGGGASEGIRQALGRSPHIAINHDPDAISMHAMNHPDCIHITEDVFRANPFEVIGDNQVGYLHASPDCTFFSRARGGKPVKKNIRSLAWVVVHWAQLVRPRVITLENVSEFQEWGPLNENNLPIPAKKGMTFRLWCNQLRGLGYKVEFRELIACDYGAPTIRKRLFMIARCDGQPPIIWPEPTHGPTGNLFGLTPYRTAAKCIDWTIPCPSIFERKKPLAEATMRRIAKGLKKYVLDNPNPFIMKYYSGNRFGLVSAFLTKFYGTTIGSDMRQPVPTITATGQHIGEVRVFLVKYFGQGTGQGVNEPLHTITSRDRFGLVTVQGQKYQIADIGLRMLQPRELALAQGFPADYILTGTKSNQVAKIGNSVPPQVIRALVKANVELKQIKAVG
ncbi:MAG TPA: DNA cytosine methyltransferase [Phycisphaerae bacterium]|nr:DNA cytosine methyltransferase [Phycisphaerae bacterium]